MGTTLIDKTYTDDVKHPESSPSEAESVKLLIEGGVTEIMRRIPHRYPFLLIDKVLEIETGKRILACKNVSINEPFFQGHFPGKPLMPGVLIIEAIAQSGSVLLTTLPQYRDKLIVFAGINDCRFKRQVVPGDQLILEGEITKLRDSFGKASGKATVDGEVVCTCELMFSFIKGIDNPNL